MLFGTDIDLVPPETAVAQDLPNHHVWAAVNDVLGQNYGQVRNADLTEKHMNCWKPQITNCVLRLYPLFCYRYHSHTFCGATGIWRLEPFNR